MAAVHNGAEVVRGIGEEGCVVVGMSKVAEGIVHIGI